MTDSHRLAFAAAATLVAIVAGPSPASARAGDACAFRTAAVVAFFEASDLLAVASSRLGTASPEDVRGLCRRARTALAAEGRRARREGRDALGVADVRRQRRRTRRARTLATRIARRLARSAGAGEKARASPVLARDLARLRGLAGDELVRLGGAGCVPGALRTTYLHVARGETRRLPAGGVVWTAVEGIDVHGTIAVPAGTGDLTLVAETGAVLLDGAVVFERDATGLGARASVGGAAEKRAAPRTAGGDGRDGGGVLVEARSGDLRISGSHFFITGDGGDAQPVTLETLAGSYTGPRGGHGGDVVLRAPAGEVEILPRRPDDPPPFTLGNGGAGADVALSPVLVTTGAQLGVQAGWGGESGRLLIEARAASYPGGVERAFRGAAGGRGGTVSWEPAGEPPLKTDTVLLVGGVGGEGTLVGGRGGDARYRAHGVVNAPGGPVTAIAVDGGSGGAAMVGRERGLGFWGGTEDRFQGGRGGDAEAFGGHGLPGTSAPGGHGRDGAPGQSVKVGGGQGGAVPNDRHARAGAGGDVTAASGAGGDGAGACDGGRGGAGGAAGALEARGGDGGSVSDRTVRSEPTASAPAFGGDGGAVRHAEVGAPGRGGEGSPPGTCGPVAAGDEVSGGEGGDGFLLGALGPVAQVIFGVCNAEPVGCDPETPPPPPACGQASGARSYVRSEERRYLRELPEGPGASRVIRTAWTEVGTESCDDLRCEFDIYRFSTTERQERRGDGTVETITRDEEVSYRGIPSLLLHATHCTGDGDLYRAGTSGTETVYNGAGTAIWQVTVSCAGCECLEAYGSDQSPPTQCCSSSFHCRPRSCDPELNQGDVSFTFCVPGGETGCHTWVPGAFGGGECRP